jgi:hypothetical protein
MQEESLAEEGTEEARVTLPSLESTLNVWCSVVGLDKEGRNGHLLITAESTTQSRTSSSSSQGRGPSQVDDKSSLKIKSFSTGTISMSGGGGEGCWPCQSCTYLNTSKTWRCEMCRADRVPLLLKAEASKRSSLHETFDSTIRTKRRGQSLSENAKKCSKDSEEQTPHSRPCLNPRQVAPLSPRVSLPVSSTRVLMSDDQIDCFFFKLQDPTDRYQPPVVVMIGRRVGDMRMGKNLLIGNSSLSLC